MKKTSVTAVLLMTFCMTSCVSMEAFGRDYRVYLNESYDNTKARIASYDSRRTTLTRYSLLQNLM